METIQEKSLEELFRKATLEQREVIRMLLKEKAGQPTRGKRPSGSGCEPDDKLRGVPYKMCDNCSLTSYQQDVNDPTVLNQGCPLYSMRKFDEKLQRMVCLQWTNRWLTSIKIDEEDEDKSSEC